MLITETGSIVAGAESYASVAQADARCASLGLTAWAALADAAKEVSLRKAADYMAVYRASWIGSRISAEQTLDWPRYGVTVDGFAVLSTVVPVAVANACIDLAYRASTAELLPDTERAIASESIGPISTIYEAGSSQNVKYTAVDRMLAPYIGGGSSLLLVRA